MEKITAIIPTYNEEHNINEALASVSWADEVIVVDSYSTDKTAQISKERGAKVLQHEYINPAAQKNWIIPQAKYEWIFILDADERVSSSLKDEITKTLSNSLRIYLSMVLIVIIY